MAKDAATAIRDFARILVKNRDRYEIVSLKTLEGEIKERIFTRPQGKGTRGRSLNAGVRWTSPRTGDYSSSYAKKRRSRGRQIAGKDLEFEGHLRRSIQVGTSGNDNVLGFTNDFARKKAEYQEDQLQKSVFTPSSQELDLMVDAYISEVVKTVRRANI